jgi:pimeloyl-ACP methyl ester carboxylesterase
VTGGAIWSRETGEGPLVALVHGSMDRSGGMLRVQRALLPAFRVLRYDRRGYGRSLPAGPPATFEQQVDDLAGLLGGRRAVLVGHSFGGLVCLALAQRRPTLVRAVVAYEAPAMWEPWWPRTSAGSQALDVAGEGAPGSGAGERAAEWFLRRLIGDAMWNRLPAATRAARRAEGPTLLAELRSVRPPAPAPVDPTAILVPMVVARGSESGPHHRRASEALARSAGHGELRTIAGAGHGAHLTHPTELAALVRRAANLAAEAPTTEAGGAEQG